jgi:hypothetical protein
MTYDMSDSQAVVMAYNITVYLPDIMPEDMPEYMPEHMPEYMPDKMPNRMSEDIYVR